MTALPRLFSVGKSDAASVGACDRELVHHLQLSVLRHAIMPKSLPAVTGSLAFRDLAIRTSNDFAVKVGQHPGMILIRMLQHRIHLKYPVTG